MSLRVAFYEPYPQLRGGAQRTTELLAAGLRERGAEVLVLVPSGGPTVDALREQGTAVEIVALPERVEVYGHRAGWSTAATLPGAWVRLGRALRRFRPDVVHATNLRGGLLVAPAARALRRPVIWHVHWNEPRARLNRAVHRLAARTVVPTAAAGPGLVGVDDTALTVIPNAVPPEVVGTPPVPPAGRPTLVTASRLVPVKGIDVLIEAASRLTDRWPDLQVEVWGAGQAGHEDHPADLRSLIARLGLEGTVHLRGPVPAPWERYPSDGVYVQPARDELLPVAILEAMGRGLPVVATAVGGVAEAVGDGRTGLLVPPGDPIALADALRTLLADPERAARLGAAGAAACRADFGVDVMTDRWWRLLTEVAP